MCNAPKEKCLSLKPAPNEARTLTNKNGASSNACPLPDAFSQWDQGDDGLANIVLSMLRDNVKCDGAVLCTFDQQECYWKLFPVEEQQWEVMKSMVRKLVKAALVAVKVHFEQG